MSGATAIAATLAVGMLLAACATEGEPGSAAAAAASSGRDCFNANSVNSFRPAGSDAVDVEISRDQVYRLTLGGGCFNIDWAQRIALRSRGGSFICSPGSAELLVPSSLGTDRCLVTNIRRLSAAEIAERRSRD